VKIGAIRIHARIVRAAQSRMHGERGACIRRATTNAPDVRSLAPLP